MFGFYRIATCVPVVRVADPAFNAEQILNVGTVKPPVEPKQEPVTMPEEKLPTVRIPTKKKKKCRIHPAWTESSSAADA